MEIPMKAKVICTDGNCGHVSCVVINPMNYDITHVVVEEDHYPYMERIVPEEYVERATSDSLFISCKRNEFLQMEEFIDHRFVHVDKVHGVYPARRHVYLPYGWPIHQEFADIHHERIPPGEIAFHRGAEVKAVDGTIGKVNEFLVDPESGHITHVIIRKDHLWGKKEKAISVSRIDHVEENTVYLDLDKKSIKELPDITVHRSY